MSRWQIARKYGGPLTLVWAGLCADIGALSEGWIDWKWAVAYAALLLIAVGLLFIFREVATVHTLTNSQHTAAMERIEQLTQALIDGGKSVPDAPPAKEAAAS